LTFCSCGTKVSEIYPSVLDTHLRLVIKPDKGGKPCRATIPSLLVR
jgi:hypothetical protein